MFSENALQRLLAIIPHNAVYHSPLDGLIIYHSDRPFSYENIIQEPSICIVMNGEREVRLGGQSFCFNPQHFMFCPVDVPMCGRVLEATPEDPFVVLSMKIDLSMVNQILFHQKIDVVQHKGVSEVFMPWHLDRHLENAFERLLLLHENPKNMHFIASLIQQEIYYRLLQSDQGEQLRQMVNFDSNTQKIAKATQYLQKYFRETVRMDTLAELSGMSLSGFHHHFKALTTLSPLQYQKSLRLIEAKRLITQENIAVSAAAYQVGYESPSQFSREYKRYFGVTPSER